MNMQEVAQKTGVSARGQLPYSSYQITQMVAGGSLRRLRRGWYATNGAHPEVERAVALGGCLSCVSALKLFGAWTPLEDTLHIRYPREARRRGPKSPGCSYPADWPVNWPVDPPLIAWKGITRCVTAEEVIAITDSVLRLGLIAPGDLKLLPAGIRSWINPTAESGSESLVRVRLQKRGIAVKTQVVISGIGRVDLLVGEKLILECDSVAHHTDLTNYRKDRKRDRVALVKGYMVMRLTWEDIMFCWDEVLCDILSIIRGDRHRRRTN